MTYKFPLDKLSTWPPSSLADLAVSSSLYFQSLAANSMSIDFRVAGGDMLQSIKYSPVMPLSPAFVAT